MMPRMTAKIRRKIRPLERKNGSNHYMKILDIPLGDIKARNVTNSKPRQVEQRRRSAQAFLGGKTIKDPHHLEFPLRDADMVLRPVKPIRNLTLVPHPLRELPLANLGHRGIQREGDIVLFPSEQLQSTSMKPHATASKPGQAETKIRDAGEKMAGVQDENHVAGPQLAKHAAAPRTLPPPALRRRVSIQSPRETGEPIVVNAAKFLHDPFVRLARSIA